MSAPPAGMTGVPAIDEYTTWDYARYSWQRRQQDTTKLSLFALVSPDIPG
jgi:hypothetical protein